VSNKNVEGWEVFFFLQDFCAVNFGGRKNFSVESKNVLLFVCLFFFKSQRLYQAQSVPQVFHLMPPFSIIQKFFTIFLQFFVGLLVKTVLFFLFFYLWNI